MTHNNKQKVINKQLESLSGQRESLVDRLAVLDGNKSNSSLEESRIDKQINIIDGRIDMLIDKLH